MTWQNYQQTKSGRLASIGILDGCYVMERKIQSGMASEFRKITKEQYDHYEDWKDDEAIINQMRCIDIWCIGYFLTSEFRILQA